MTNKEIQNALISLGYKPGKVDGIIGKKTVAAVKAYQKARKLKIDGIPGTMTQAMLKKDITPLPKPEPIQIKVEPIVNKYDPKDAVKYYESVGWNRIQAVALVANLMFESGGNQTWTIKFNAHGDKDKYGIHRSHGAGQWNERAGRYDPLMGYAKGLNRPWDDPYVQLSYLQRELLITERKAAAKLRAAETLEDAVNAAIGIWRPSIPHADKRLAVAQRLYDSYA